MLKIGLTGGIGSGKTAVSNLFSKLGIPVIDTDVIARQLIENDLDVQTEITRIFTKDILDNNGSVNRKKLARIIFNDSRKKQQLENILHPAIRQHVKHQLQQFIDSTYIIIVVPLLLETDFRKLVDRILVVVADENLRIQRVMHRDNRSESDIRSIIKNQGSDDYRMKNADDIIENNCDINMLKDAVAQLNKKYASLSTTIK